MSMELENLDLSADNIKKYEVQKASASKTVKADKADTIVKGSKALSGDVNAKTAVMNGEDKETTEKMPTKTSMKEAVSMMNQKLGMMRTRCEYEYDDSTNRVAIKVYDKDTDELLIEAPPEEAREAIKKVWEAAGIVVDEKL